MKALTKEEFNKILLEFLEGQTMQNILDIPEAYEVLAEEFNNEVIEIWRINNEMCNM